MLKSVHTHMYCVHKEHAYDASHYAMHQCVYGSMRIAHAGGMRRAGVRDLENVKSEPNTWLV